MKYIDLLQKRYDDCTKYMWASTVIPIFKQFVNCQDWIEVLLLHLHIWLRCFTKYFHFFVLIHSANPKSRPLGTIVYAHVVRPSVRPNFSNLAKQSNRNNVRYWRDMGLAEWIIDDTCLVQIVAIKSLKGSCRIQTMSPRLVMYFHSVEF